MKHQKIEAEVHSPDCDNHVWLYLRCRGRHVGINLGDAGSCPGRDALELAGLVSVPSPRAEMCEGAEGAKEPSSFRPN